MQASRPPKSSVAAQAFRRAQATSRQREKIQALKEASNLLPATPELEVSYELVPLDRIVVPADRLRGADPAKVEAIAHSYRIVGQLQPIRVLRTNGGALVLDIGLHRVLAARAAGWMRIQAGVVAAEDIDRNRRRLQEIFENLLRAELTALERAIALSELKVVHEALHPETRHGGDRGNQHTGGKSRQVAIFAFSQTVAERVGLSERSIELAVSIAKGLCASVRSRLVGTWLADHQAGLQALSQQPEETQHAVLDILFSTPPGAASVVDAIVLAQGKKLPSTADKRFRSVSDGMVRCTAAERQQLYSIFETEILAWAAERLATKPLSGWAVDD
jgi:ParB family chromosome partitioning protein